VLAFSRFSKSRRRAKKNYYVGLGLLPLLLGLLVGCGNGSSGGSNGASRGAGHPGTPSANYAITVNGAVSTVTRSVQVFVTVK